MVVALDSVVECVHAQIEHAVVRVGILMDDFVHKARLIMRCKVLRSHEMARVEVSLADRYEVKEHEEYYSHTGDGQPALEHE